jgi:hypothetical protein
MVGSFSQGRGLQELAQVGRIYAGFPQVKGTVGRRVQFCLILCLLLFAKKKKRRIARGFSRGRWS